MPDRKTLTLVHLFVAGSVTLGVIVPRVAFRPWYAANLGQAAGAAAIIGSRERERNWERLRFVELTNSSLANILLERICWDQTGLELDQTLKLKARIAQVAAYLQNPAFDEYYRL